MARATAQTNDVQTRGWHAWIDRMPPAPARLHVVGEVEVGNPGIAALLVSRDAPDAVAGSLQLHLYLAQRPELWPQVMVWVNASYEKVLIPDDPSIDTVEVFYGGSCLVRLPVAKADERSPSWPVT